MFPPTIIGYRQKQKPVSLQKKTENKKRRGGGSLRSTWGPDASKSGCKSGGVKLELRPNLVSKVLYSATLFSKDMTFEVEYHANNLFSEVPHSDITIRGV